MSDDNPRLQDLKLNPAVLAALKACGFRRLNDLRRLTNVQLLSLPNMGGASYKKVLAALGRPPIVGGPTYKRRRNEMRENMD